MCLCYGSKALATTSIEELERGQRPCSIGGGRPGHELLRMIQSSLKYGPHVSADSVFCGGKELRPLFCRLCPCQNTCDIINLATL